MGWGEGCIENVLQLQLSILSQVGVYLYGKSSKLVRLIPTMEQQRQIGEALRQSEIPKAVTLHDCI